MIYRSEGEIVASGETSWSSPFDEVSLYREGEGYNVEGTVSALRNHHVKDSSGRFHRYTVVELDVSRVRRRTYNSMGEETEEHLYEKENSTRTGYLFTKRVDVEDPHLITIDTLVSELGGTLPSGLFDSVLDDLHPSVANKLEFWGPPALVKGQDLKRGSDVKLKTKQNSIFIDTVTNKKKRAANYAGESVGDAWGDKILDVKGTGDAHLEAGPVDDDEWDADGDDEWGRDGDDDHEHSYAH